MHKFNVKKHKLVQISVDYNTNVNRRKEKYLNKMSVLSKKYRL